MEGDKIEKKIHPIFHTPQDSIFSKRWKKKMGRMHYN